jgi:hypothetical protein
MERQEIPEFNAEVAAILNASALKVIPIPELVLDEPGVSTVLSFEKSAV